MSEGDLEVPATEAESKLQQHLQVGGREGAVVEGQGD